MNIGNGIVLENLAKFKISSLLKIYFILFATVFSFACGPKQRETYKETFERKAFYYYDHGNSEAAIPFLDSLIALDSTNGTYYFKRAYSYDNLEYKNRAFADYQRAIKLKCNVASAYYNMALGEIQEDNDSLALLYFASVLKADPSKTQIVEHWVKMCNEQIKFQKTKAYREYVEHKKRLGIH